MSSALSVEITTAEGARFVWDSDSDANSRPLSISFATKRGEGFDVASIVLPRRVDRDHPDLGLFNDVRITGANGAVAYEGRITAIPRSLSDGHTITVQCAGWMSHARDRKFREIYVDRDLSHWHGPSRAQRINLINSSHSLLHEGDVIPDPDTSLPALALKFNSLPANAHGQAWYDAAGVGLDRIYYDLQTLVSGGASYSATWNVNALLSTGDNTGTATVDISADLEPSGSGYHAATGSGRTYAAVRQLWPSTAAGDGDWTSYWRNLAVYGTHGLTAQGTDPKGFFASDVIRNIVARFCPKLSSAGVVDTTYPLPHLTFRDRTYPYDAFLEVNKHHLWHLAVWEDRVLHYEPFDLTGADWEVRTDDAGVEISLQGDSTENLANGIVVRYFDVGKGRHHEITPDDTAELADSDPNNPANRHGLTVWTELDLSSPTTEDAATEIGRAWLAKFNRPRAPGTITVRGHIRDAGGSFQPAWMPRAGQSIAVTNHPNDRPRLIHETTYSAESDALTVAVEGPMPRLDAYLDRLAAALSAQNLSSA